ncbi:MAG: hypothetical protein DMG08_03340 [Acidobacteria bacterium]|nr:MAG: hypothetical protein DMG08_03340 [Acidobacteriota bacterium]
MYRRLPAGKGRVDPKGVVEAQMPARRRRYDFFSRPQEGTEIPLNCGLRIVLLEKLFINCKSEIRNRESAIKGYFVSPR